MVEVFTAAGLPVGTDNMGDRVQVFEVDGIERFEAALSHGLPPDRDAARGAALGRIGQLKEGQIRPVRSAASGLCKAMQYDIDRYPAVVFDGQAVVYGVTDLADAFHRYRGWQKASGR